MAGIKIPFVAEVRDFLRGTRDVEGALDDVGDSLDDLARDAQRSGDKAGDELADGITDGTREAGDAAEKLERTFRDTFDDVKKEAKRAGDTVGKESKAGFDSAGRNTEEFRDEAKQNFSEVTSSFSGDMASITDLAQGTLGGLASTLSGPLGIALGGAAIGVGAVFSQLEQAAEKANELTEEAAAFATEMGSAETAEQVGILRDRWREIATSIADARSVWEVWQPRAITNAERFASAIEAGYLNVQDLNDAFNDPNPERRLEALRTVAEQATRAQDEYNAAVRDSVPVLEFAQDATDQDTEALVERAKVSGDVLNAIKEEIATQEAAVAITEALAASEGLTVEAYEARQAAMDEAAAVQESYNAAVEAAADPVAVFNETVKEGTAANEDYTVSVDDMIATWLEQAEAAKNFEANLEEIGSNGGQALADELREKGPEVAGAAAAALAEAGPEKQREAIAAYAKASGAATADAIAQGVTDGKQDVYDATKTMYSGLPTGTAKIEVDLTQAESDINEFIRRQRSVRVDVRRGTGFQRYE